MTNDQSVLLQLLSKALFNRSFPPLNTNWSGVLKEAHDHAVVQLAYSALEKSLLTPEEAKAWKRYAAADIANNIIIGHNHSLLHEWLEGIPYVILKGSASASYYPTPSYRSMGDVDFLVKAEDLGRAGKALEEQGLKPWDEEHISHIVYRGPQMHYEMHFNLTGTPEGAAGELVKEYTKDIFEKAQEKTVGTGTAMLPSPFHHGLILLLHTCHHLTGEGVGLRHLCDWAVFEDSFSEKDFCELFEEKLKKLGLWRFARILTRASIKYLGADERSWAETDEDLVDSFMEDILVSGHFGFKDSQRSNQAYLISSRGKNGVGKTSFSKQFFVSMNNVVYTRWPFAKRWKLALPVGWVYYGTKQIIKISKGKRKKIHLRQMIKGAEQRKKLYSRFFLYEPEI